METSGENRSQSQTMLPLYKGIFILILLSGIIILGVMLLWKKSMKQMTNAPASTVISTTNWKTYTSNSQGFSVQYPTDWTVTEPTSGDNAVYLNAPVIKRNGTEPIEYRVWLNELSNPDRLSFKDLATQNLSSDLKKQFIYTKERVGEKTVYKTTKLPSGQGALRVFVTTDDKRYISIGFTPYFDQKPYEGQEKYLNIFNSIIPTVHLHDVIQNTQWKTYTNETYGISFLYPPDFILDVAEKYDQYTPLHIALNRVDPYFEGYIEVTTKTEAEILAANEEGFSKVPITISQIPTFRYYGSSGMAGRIFKERIIVSNEDYRYHFQFGTYYTGAGSKKNDPETTQILSTVNLSAIKPSTDIATWNIYRDDQLHIMIKYPPTIVVVPSMTHEGSNVFFAKKNVAQHDFREINNLEILLRDASTPELALQNECSKPCVEKFEPVTINNAVGIRTLGLQFASDHNYYLIQNDSKGKVIRLVVTDHPNVDTDTDLQPFYDMIHTFGFTSAPIAY